MMVIEGFALVSPFLLNSSVTFDLLSQNDETGLYSHLTGVPKALLPGIRGKKILDFWWETVNMCVSPEIGLFCSFLRRTFFFF